jgi:hypothetical protein
MKTCFCTARASRSRGSRILEEVAISPVREARKGQGLDLDFFQGSDERPFQKDRRKFRRSSDITTFCFVGQQSPQTPRSLVDPSQPSPWSVTRSSES